jgi:hypothetical protein
MASGYTIFTTYVFVPTSGNSQAVHCNYIKSLQLSANNINVQEINISFSNPDDFKFLSNSITAGTGFTANKIYAVIQLVNNSGYTNANDAKPDPANWKVVDLISGNTGLLTPAILTNQVFKISLLNYGGFSGYTLSYLNYPTKFPADNNKLCFGDEIYFLGNVSTDIHADVFVTDLAIILGQNQFNSSTNPTWLQIPSSSRPAVAITEIGIYTEIAGVKYLVAIGKLNDPLVKDSSISRTLVFDIDF